MALPLCALALLVSAFSRAGGSSPAIVSLTFDDGTSSQPQAAAALDARGLKGTFYVNSAMLGTSGWYMTLNDVRGLAAAGHEIGGHTLHHAHLTTLTTDQAQSEICADRQNLLSWGFQPTDFAYPFGEYDASVESIVRGCGYSSARTTSGFMTALPPGDLYALPAPPSVTTDTTVGQIESWVSRAETGGKWMPITFHHLCAGAGCDYYSIAPADFGALLDWLAAEQQAGRLRVETVAQAMGDAPAPPQPPPPASPPAAPPNCNLCTTPAYPNPWRGDRDAGRSLRINGLAPNSRLLIYSVSGRRVRGLDAPAGYAEWDLRDDSGASVPSGYYLYRGQGTDGPRRGALAIVR